MKSWQRIGICLCAAGILCSCLGACLWLSRVADLEPLLQLERQGDQWLLRWNQKTYYWPLEQVRQVSEELGTHWILLPLPWRLGIKQVMWLWNYSWDKINIAF